MADYHCSVKAISRAKGRSAVAAAAYRQAMELTDERIGEVHDYTRKAGVEHSELVLPDIADLPAWARDREKLWNAAEKAEIRKDAKVAREWEVALPHELTPAQRQELAVAYAKEIANRYGIAVDVAIHAPARHGDERNHHAHLLATTRRIGPDGLGEKTRVLDSPRTSGAEVEQCRATWATLANQALRMAGHDIQVDHRSLKVQRGEAEAIANDNSRPEPERQLAEVRAIALDREPTQHLGATATAMERAGIETGRGDDNRAIRAENAERQSLWQQVREWGHQVKERAHQVVDQVKERAFDLAGRVVDQVKPLTPEQRETLTTVRDYRDAVQVTAESGARLSDDAKARGIDPRAHPGFRAYQVAAHARDALAARIVADPERYNAHLRQLRIDPRRLMSHANAQITRDLQRRIDALELQKAQAKLTRMTISARKAVEETRARMAAMETQRLENQSQSPDPVVAFRALAERQRQASQDGQTQQAQELQRQMRQRAQDIQRTGQMDRLRQQDAQAAQQAQQMSQSQKISRGHRFKT